MLEAMDLGGLGVDRLRRIAFDDAHRIRIDALRDAIARDRAAGLTPFLVVGSAGTVDVGAIDDLAALADVAREEDLHFHVDAAIGAFAILSEELAPRIAGIERADSIGLDWHKLGQVPYDAGFLLTRDGELQKRTFASPAAYLRRDARGLAGGEWWPSDYGPDLSRGFRALKTWFTLKAYGTRALGAVAERNCALAAELGRRVAAEPALELLAPVQLNIVCFRHRGPDPDRLNAEIVARLYDEGRVAPSLTTVDGRAAIRAALVNHRIGPGEIDALLEATLRLGGEILARDGAA
jgi:aromatic-L-amino-acid decarboxylase